ncbi:hypothetical protein AB0F68_06930 [Micromonospora sp. NPDC023966]|uniref:SLOG cluster 4 domain-containing protein n=1 Tax=Micromonospora sp. NPDC023966 TaxID=3154699 RepID=UPI0033C48F8B
MPAENLTNARQIAVLGSAGDLATATELDHAAAVGRELALRGITCLVGGDDGVMGAAAQAVKDAGGKTVALLPRGGSLGTPSRFDVVIDTGLSWVQFGDSLIRSCRGAVVVGGGAGTLAQLSMLYLSQRPAVFLGSESVLAGQFGNGWLDGRCLIEFPVRDDAPAALDLLISLTERDQSPEEVLATARALHFASYPFGDRAAYLDSGELYRFAAIQLVGEGDPVLRTDAYARMYDSLGDHQYYCVGDFLAAAVHYRAARARLGPAPADPAFANYLEAIMLESVAFALHEFGEHQLAATAATASARRYAAGIPLSDQSEHPYLKHSSDGLDAAAALFEAHALHDNGRLDEAMAALDRAEAGYRLALRHNPRWGADVSSDNYERSMSRVRALQARIARPRRTVEDPV